MTAVIFTKPAGNPVSLDSPLGRGAWAETGNSWTMAHAGRAAPACKPVRALQGRAEHRNAVT